MNDTPLRVSASKIKTYMGCPLQAKFIYKDRLPQQQNAYATFGTCVHSALERYNTTGDLEDALKYFEDIWENPEKINAAIEVWPPTLNFGGARQRGIDMIRGYHEKVKWEQRTVLATEHRFLVPFGRYELTGVVDLLELRKSAKGRQTLLVVDYKTNKRQPYQSTLKIDVQFTVYRYAVEQPEFWIGNGPEFPEVPNGSYWSEMLKGVPRRAIWHHLETNKEMDTGPREEFDYKRLYRVCQMIEKTEQAGIYMPDISGDNCGICSFTAQCGLDITPDAPDDEEAWI